MISSAHIIIGGRKTICGYTIAGQKAAFDVSAARDARAFDLEIKFELPVEAFRTHDYRWSTLDSDYIGGAFAPKIIKVDGKYVQPSAQTGIWEVNQSDPKRLLWRFNPDGATPLTVYGSQHIKTIEKARPAFPDSLALLFGNDAVEFSRSPIPFSAIACFTDHCDFDTAESLALQREFFKKVGVKVTKGFFLNHFSKREDNASFERNAAELGQWRADGHELAYHSLSQSIKHDRESFDDFENFIAPYPDLPTWIDHGYQPYNLSLYAHSIGDAAYADILRRKKIGTLWNYVDSGTTTLGVINQLNPDDFTLKRFGDGNAGLNMKTRARQLVKNIMFHYYADERIIDNYKQTAGNVKKVVYQKRIKSIWPLIKSFLKLSTPILGVLLNWNSSKNKPFKLAKYTPVVFRHSIAGHDFCVFQTLEMIDFVKSLAPQNIEKLVKEHGLFIAHTYFSVPASYHQGKMFQTPEKINPTVAANFQFLGEKIKLREIWNPTLAELVGFLANFEKTVLDTDANGNIIVVESSHLPYRNVS
jgi:hypothetical protein